MNEPLILLPGMMCDARIFAGQIAPLSRDRAVMIAPLVGERVEEMASAVLDSAPARFALAGLSLGGIVAMELLRRAPERITRVALMDTTPLNETPQEAAAREPQIIAARTGRFDEVMREQVLTPLLRAGPHKAAQLAYLMEMAHDLGPEAFVRQSRALQRRRDQQPTLRKVRQPALILCGEEDRLTPLKRHEFMSELVPYAQLRVIEEAGHLSVLDQPDAVTAALQEWMRQPLVLR